MDAQFQKQKISLNFQHIKKIQWKCSRILKNKAGYPMNYDKNRFLSTLLGTDFKWNNPLYEDEIGTYFDCMASYFCCCLSAKKTMWKTISAMCLIEILCCAMTRMQARRLFRRFCSGDRSFVQKNETNVLRNSCFKISFKLYRCTNFHERLSRTEDWYVF